MSDEQTPIKIVIPVEEEAPFVPERAGTNVKSGIRKAGEQVGKVARNVWASGARKKVTGGIRRGATAVAAKGSQVIQDKVVQTAERQAREGVTAVQTRIRETEWKQEAKAGTARGLRWLSRRLAQLADRFGK